MLDLEIVPEEGLQSDTWEILLGMHFSQVVAIIQSQVRTIKAAHVVYNETAPLDNDLILDLPTDGLRFMFDSQSQRLKLIEVYNMKAITLKYCGAVFNGPSVVATVEQIDRCFGATRPGSYDKLRQLFALNFRGLTFYFPVELQFQPHYSHGLGSLRFPGDASPILSKILLYIGVSPLEAPVCDLPKSCFKGHVYAEEVTVLRNTGGTRSTGLKLKLFTAPPPYLDTSRVVFEREIKFKEHVQSITAKLGSPQRIFYKGEDKMKIHSKNAHKRVTAPKSDYFLNYFTLGIDILIDSKSHRACKFILHSNFPGHYDFNSYYRCPFSLRLGRESTVENSIGLLLPNCTGNNSNNTGVSNNLNPNPINNSGGNGKKGGGKGSGKGKKKSNCEVPALIQEEPPEQQVQQQAKSLTITFASHWEEVVELVGDGRPVVLTRSSANNPFGSSLCYGVQDIIFEVMANDHIASVTLYDEASPLPPEEHLREPEELHSNNSTSNNSFPF